MAEQDLSRPYIGYRSAGRRPESQQDRVASANAPLSAIRGYVAGTLGLPGDIEGLGRMLIPGVSNESYIPGSEYFRKVLPMQDLENTPTGRAFSEVGNLTSGAGLMQAAKAGKAGARVVGEELNRAILDNSGALARLVPQAAKPMYVVKPEAGNWLAGSIESAVYPLKPGVLNETGLKNLAERAGVDVAEEVAVRQQPSIYLNKWIDQKVGKYVRNEMATPSDSLRLLADKGISHMQPDPNRSVFGYIPTERERAGFPKEGLAKTPLGKQWEDRADELITNRSAGIRLKQGSVEGGFDSSVQDLIDNPWLAKVPPETSVYSLGGPYGTSQQARSLGFDHLIDELKNAIDPNSTLPANLRLKYGDLDKVTMPDAVKLVSKINDWRAVQAAEAEKAGMLGNLIAEPRLQDPTTQLSFVEKPGMTWIDIPATIDKNAKKLCTTIGKQAGWCTQGDSLAVSYGSGNNRLTTLLDAEGRPHAQAKISSIPQTGDIMEDIDDIMQTMSAAQRRKFNGYLGSDDFSGDQEEALEWLQNNMPKAYDRYIASVNIPPSITELKPVGNTFSSDRAREYTKRDPQYQAKITDSIVKFLNAGNWSKVNDLDMYDIADLKDPSSVQNMLSDILHYDLSSERAAKFNEAIDMSPDANRFMSRSQFREFVDPNSGKEGFAEGGSVSAYDPNLVDEIMNSLDEPTGYASGGKVRMAQGGSVTAYDPDQIDAIANQYM